MRLHDRKSAEELFKELNDTDESERLEAKSIRYDTTRSLLETVCAFSNEPQLGGGIIMLGIAEKKDATDVRYEVEDIADLDKRQLDLASQCKTCFNRPIFPSMTAEKIGGKRVLVIEIEELPAANKPLYFKANKLPDGAYRRVGTADVVCTSDDLCEVFDNTTASYDATPIRGASIDEVDESAIEAYRQLRAKVNPSADELQYDNAELLKALNCVSVDDPRQLNIAGVLLFGTAKLQRRVMPMARVDYIRVPTMTWVENPGESYSALDMRGPFMTLVDRIINAVNDDLVKDFSLPPGSTQSSLQSVPWNVLREAVVNALMHASYKVGSPTQIVRYPNRIEIINAGYSLKSPERFSTSGSVPRNKNIAPVFHETNLAETKGGGMNRMARDMRSVHLTAPTYESDRASNTFTLRLLLHHFLNDRDLLWLKAVENFDLTDGQKMALVFLREVGAIDNNAYRQISGQDTLRSSYELRRMRELGLIAQKGRGQRTYYRAGDDFPAWNSIDKPLNSINKDGNSINKDTNSIDKQLEARIRGTSRRLSQSAWEELIVDLCSLKLLSSNELAKLLERTPVYVTQKLSKMVKAGKISYRYPLMPNHPDQSYGVRGKTL